MSENQSDERRWAEDMARAHRGDVRRYDQLLRELGAVIEQYVQRRFGSVSFVEDCVQECLMAIHAARHTYDPRRPFRPWFFTIVRNKTIDVLRRANRAAERPGSFVAAGATDPAEEVAAGDLLGRLSPEHAHALTLTKIDGYSLSEAAASAGVSVAAMRSRVSRALLATEQLLSRESD